MIKIIDGWMISTEDRQRVQVPKEYRGRYLEVCDDHSIYFLSKERYWENIGNVSVNEISLRVLAFISLLDITSFDKKIIAKFIKQKKETEDEQ